MPRSRARDMLAGALVAVICAMPGMARAADPRPAIQPVEEQPQSQPAASQPAASQPVKRGGPPDLPKEETSLGTLDEPSTVTIERTGKAQDHALPRRLGPAAIKINDRGDRIAFGFATQLQFRFDQAFSGGGADADSDHELTFRRLRTVLSSSFLQGSVRSSFQLNIAPNALELIDMWLYVAPISQLAVRMGQFKVPFTRYRLQSFAALSLADWSPVSQMFGGERQLGAELFNPTAGSLGWEYAVGVFTGVNARGSHGVDITRVYGEIPDNPSDLTNPSFPAQFHPELVGRVARNFAGIDTSSNTDAAGGPLRASVGLSAAWDIQPQVREDLAARAAFEALIKLHGFHLNAVAYLAWFERQDGAALGPWGLLVEGGYRITRLWEVALRYSHVGLTQALRDDAQAYAAEQIGDGSDPDRNAQYEMVGKVSATNELAMALNAYVIGRSLKGQLEAAWMADDTDSGYRHELRIIAQTQLQF